MTAKWHPTMFMQQSAWTSSGPTRETRIANMANDNCAKQTDKDKTADEKVYDEWINGYREDKYKNLDDFAKASGRQLATIKAAIERYAERERTRFALMELQKIAIDNRKLAEQFERETDRKFPKNDMEWMALAAEYGYPAYGVGNFDPNVICAWIMGKSRANGKVHVNEPTPPELKPKKRGLKKVEDKLADDVYVAWQTGQYKTYADLTSESKFQGLKPLQVKQIVDRYRKRRNN